MSYKKLIGGKFHKQFKKMGPCCKIDKVLFGSVDTLQAFLMNTVKVAKATTMNR
jgi:hypothetical protein